MTDPIEQAGELSDELSILAQKVRTALERSPMTVAELSSKFDRGVTKIEHALEWLRERHINVQLSDGEAAILADIPAGGEIHINPTLYKGTEYRFGIATDNHLGSKYERLDVLNALYDKFAERGITDVFNAGNAIDGRCRFNQFDLLPSCESMEGQISYFVTHYPLRNGIRTRFIAGNDHEGWWSQREGVNIGKLMESRAREAGRTDLEYLGYLEADVLIRAPEGETWIRVMHPGGGSAYAYSYTSQKLVESLQGGEKPMILIVGHFHKMEFCIPRSVFCIQGGCTQDQTPFMRTKRLEAHVGGWSCKLVQAPDGHVSSLEVEAHQFFDRGFYEGKEKFKRW